MNYAESVIRRYASEFPGEDESPLEVVSFRAYPETDSLDTAQVTADVRGWLLDGRHSRFLFEERRKYADVGAEGSSVQFILELLGSGVAQIALEQIFEFVKDRLGGGANDWLIERFRSSSTEELRDQALSAAERGLGLSRGALSVIDFERGNFEISMEAENRSAGLSYRITLNADETLRVRALPGEQVL